MDLTGARVAVTGATGFVGRYLVRALQERGASVIAVVRNPDRVPALATAGVELRRADLADLAALTTGFRGADAVLSNAGIISIGQHDRQTVIDTNLAGTTNVVRACAEAGVGRMVMTSSATVYRPRADHFYTEDHELRSVSDFSTRLSWYALSKAAAEREAWRLTAQYSIQLSTVRPHAIHGAFDDHGATAWMRRMTSLPIGAWLAGTRFPSVYAGDLAEAICRMLERPIAAGRAYNIAGDPGEHTFWDLLRAWREAGGKASGLVLPLPAPFTRRFDISRARRDLDFTNRPLVESFRDTLRLERAASL